MPDIPDIPDFIIIGAMKSATSTLQEQLEQQTGIFMCTPKEPNFFSDDAQFEKGFPWYKALFSTAKGNQLSGEASTHYTKLPTYPNTVNRLKENLGEAKFIYVMRHPVDRLISHYLHECSMGVYKEDLDQAIDKYPEMVSYGQYSMQLLPFFKAFGRDKVCPVFFDRLVNYPQQELERICRFIGYREQPDWKFDLAPSNISSKRIRRFPLYRLLIESGTATWLRRVFIPRIVREKIKSRLTTKEKPELGKTSKERLVSSFDEDLNVLGSWLGVHLDCDNFKEVTSSRSLEWLASDD